MFKFSVLILLLNFKLNINAITTDQFPYQASFLKNTTFLCSGALISSKFVLTTASCIRKEPEFVRVGSSDLSIGGIVSEIEYYKIHSGYSPIKLFTNDIGVVCLKRIIYFDSRVKAIKIADHDPPIGLQLYAIGWGPHANSPKFNASLLSALKAVVVDKHRCNSTVYQLSRHFISEDLICTGGNGRGFCRENPGAVLATSNGILYGIATWMQICGKTLNCDLFVNVVSNREFIRSMTGK